MLFKRKSFHRIQAFLLITTMVAFLSAASFLLYLSFARLETRSYKIVVLFIVLILLSNIVAKTVIALFKTYER
jgi:hypothetical protein